MPFQFRKEAIEEDLNTNFPSQGQGNPPLYYSLSEVVVPTYNINNVAEGSSLGQNLQTAWDFSTGSAQIVNTTTTLISNTGFWRVDLTATNGNGAAGGLFSLQITDGVSTKTIWGAQLQPTSAPTITDNTFIVFLRSGDSLTGTSPVVAGFLDVWYRQIADVNGNLVNPLGFSFA